MKTLTKKKIKRIAVILVIILLPITLIGQTQSSSVEIVLADEPAVVLGDTTISLGDAIKRAITSNYDLLSGAYDVAMTDTLFQQLQKKYAWFLNAEGGYSYSKNPGSLAMLYGEEARTIDGNVSLSKGFSTGTRVTAGVSNQYSKINTRTIEFPNPFTGNIEEIELGLSMPRSHMPVLFAGVQQELLKNSFGRSDRLQDKIASNTAKMQKEVILQSLSMVVVGVIVDYWNVIIAKTNLDNTILQRDQTVRVRNIIQRNVNLGLVDSFQINYYNSLVANSEASLARARQNYASALRTFLSTINAPDIEIVMNKVILTDKLADLNEEEALKIAFAKRADYQNALLAMDNAKMNRNMVNSSGLPSLTASLQVQSIDQDEVFKTAAGRVGNFKYPTVSGRLALSHPLGDSDIKVRERNANFQLKQAELALEQTRRNINDDIKNQIDNVNASHIVYINAREARRQSETYFNRMLNNLARGRLDSATVKNGLDALIMSRQAEIGTLVGYNISLLQFLVAKNQLWERFDIDVEQYIPKD